jgi:4-amino-4-deoxy-L-arabinose transferase-like glycosyltransferase
MDTAAQPMNLTKSWLSRHPLIVIGIILAACLGPFVNKAVHWDDALYVWTAEWIQQHPADFYGFNVNLLVSAIPMWVANWNPPLFSYFLAGVASLFGWHEIALHLACLAVAFMAAAGIYSLAKMWCGRPLLATVIAIFTPAFLVSSTTLMCDVPMLTFWIWALVLWERALACSKQRGWRFAGAGVLAGLAVLTKYSAVTLLPLLPLLSILRNRKLGWWLAGLAVPLLMVAGYEWLTAEMYGRGLFSLAISHTHLSREFPGSWEARGIIGVAFAGGCLLPLLFFAPYLWRPRTWLAGGVVMLGMWLAMFPLWNNLGLINTAMGKNPEAAKHWYYLLQVAILTAGGLHLLLLAVTEGWRGRDITSVILALWIIGGFLSATVLNFAVNARSLLLIVPPTAILLVRRLEATRENTLRRGVLWPLVPSAAIALSLVMADYHLANSARTAAEQITLKYKSPGHQVWFEGHGAFQYYMEKSGGRSLDVEQSLLQPGDIVVVPEIGILTVLPPDSVGWMEHFRFAPSSWMNLMGGTENGAAGFYGANWGPVPFAIGSLPTQDYDVVKVFSWVQYQSRPANSQEVREGYVPIIPHISGAVKNNTVFQTNPEAMKQVQAARQLELNGKAAEAVQQYRGVLNLDPDNPEALNHLAWILATSSKAKLRNGEEAVQLATRAVALTDRRLPAFLGTLAVAYAGAGRFSNSVETAESAYELALLTNQKEMAANIAELMSLCSSGKAVVAAPAP